MTRPARLAVVLFAGAFGVACGDAPRDPYAVTIDLGPAIHSLGGDDDAADAAYDRLGSLGPAAVPALVAALDREAAPIRTQIVELLAALETPPLDALLAAVGDDEPSVRAAALDALGATDDARVTQAVEAGLDDASVEVRRAAAGACRRACRSPVAIDRLVALALDPDDFVLAERARGALRDRMAAGEIDAHDAVERLAAAGVETARSPGARLRAGLLLSEIGDARAVSPLVASAGDDTLPMVMRVHALAALGEVRDPRSVAGLAPFVGAEPLVIVHAACAALGRLVDAKTAGATDARARCPGRDPSGTPRP